jgi:hypothetical protein
MMVEDHPFKFQPGDDGYALDKAYVPEHIPGLMVAISQAEPFLIEGYLGYAKDNWVIFVGYPLEGQYNSQICQSLIERVRDAFRPDVLWFIGPEIPEYLKSSCRSRQSDHYYSLDLSGLSIKSSLRRQVNRVAQKLVVEETHTFGSEHQLLVDELMGRQKLPPLIVELYRSMPEYIAQCESVHVLDARDKKEKLCAFFVVETAAKTFDTYMVGCHSKVNYIPHASDLLFMEMIERTDQRGKPEINLGLGVNPGIRRFKVKWGGEPVLNYEYCECYYGPPEQLSIVDFLLGGNL